MKRSGALRCVLIAALAVMTSSASLAQIRNITSLSSMAGGGGESALGYGRAAYFIFDMLTNGFIDWQRSTLRKKAQVPSVISIEAMLQMASQPSRYYIVNPRIRANWGVLFTDYRMNYMFEKVPGGTVDMRTDDWQIIGLNLIQRPGFNARFSTGIMYERFGNNNKFNESVFGLQWRSPSGRIGMIGEYRTARNYGTGERPRTEFNASFLRTIARTASFDLSFTIGGVYQIYYSEIPVWGLQGGVMARVY
jgi:hypothetical protein